MLFRRFLLFVAERTREWRSNVVNAHRVEKNKEEKKIMRTVEIVRGGAISAARRTDRIECIRVEIVGDSVARA